MVAEMESNGGHWAAREEAAWVAFAEKVSKLLSSTEEHVYVLSEIEDSRRIQGFAEANSYMVGGAFEPKKMLHISSVFVHTDHRGTGIGRHLIEEVLNWGRSIDCETCELNVLCGNPAKRLYENIKFKEIRIQMIRDLK